MDKRERDLNKKQSQYETAKTNITLLEAKVKELQEEKRILQIRMESAIHDHTATPNVNIPGNDNIPQSSERSENRSLLEKLNNMENKMWENRAKDAEKETMVMRMKILEDRLTLQNQTPPTHVNNELMLMRIGMLEDGLHSQPHNVPQFHPKITHLQQQWIPPPSPYVHQHPQGWLPPMPYNPHLLTLTLNHHNNIPPTPHIILNTHSTSSPTYHTCMATKAAPVNTISHIRDKSNPLG